MNREDYMKGDIKELRKELIELNKKLTAMSLKEDEKRLLLSAKEIPLLKESLQNIKNVQAMIFLLGMHEV